MFEEVSSRGIFASFDQMEFVFISSQHILGLPENPQSIPYFMTIFFNEYVEIEDPVVLNIHRTYLLGDLEVFLKEFTLARWRNKKFVDAYFSSNKKKYFLGEFSLFDIAEFTTKENIKNLKIIVRLEDYGSENNLLCGLTEIN